jgi:hypothetical protein
MSAITYAELLVGLFSAVGAAILLMGSSSRTPQPLQEEIAQRIRRSIDLIDGCRDRPPR